MKWPEDFKGIAVTAEVKTIKLKLNQRIFEEQLLKYLKLKLKAAAEVETLTAKELNGIFYFFYFPPLFKCIIRCYIVSSVPCLFENHFELNVLFVRCKV